ncbi:hypothetical protein ON010_g15184 [Phytophthora cinnamomi]|nr:hypothetical protein ON010_g15184 [Phytophthora cinnamomi]
MWYTLYFINSYPVQSDRILKSSKLIALETHTFYRYSHFNLRPRPVRHAAPRPRVRLRPDAPARATPGSPLQQGPIHAAAEGARQGREPQRRGGPQLPSQSARAGGDAADVAPGREWQRSGLLEVGGTSCWGLRRSGIAGRAAADGLRRWQGQRGGPSGTGQEEAAGAVGQRHVADRGAAAQGLQQPPEAGGRVPGLGQRRPDLVGLLHGRVLGICTEKSIQARRGGHRNDLHPAAVRELLGVRGRGLQEARARRQKLPRYQQGKEDDEEKCCACLV